LRGSVGNVDVVCRVDLHVPRTVLQGGWYSVQSTKDGGRSDGGKGEWEVM